MKRILALLLFFCAAFLQAQVLDISDANFMAVLLSANTSNGIALDNGGDAVVIDTNGDNQIQQSEAEEIRELHISNAMITSLAGIEGFSNLRVLDCSFNQLTVFDATVLTDLRELYCSYNSITALTLDGLQHLLVVDASSNYLTSVSCTGLEYLEAVDFSDNNITSLDFSECPQLYAFNCDYNQISYINIKNGSAQSNVYGENIWSGNPLQYICVDEDEAAIVEGLLSLNGYTGVTVNTYCSFTPGGDYNTIGGTVLFDLAGNGCDVSDPPHCYIKLKLNDGTNDSFTFTDELGEYDFYTGIGSYSVEPYPEIPSYYTISPAQGDAVFTDTANNEFEQDFCIAATTSANDLEVVMVPVNKGVPGGNVKYKLVYKNKGNTTLNGGISCQWDYDTFSSFVGVSPTPSYVALDLYVWNFTNLRPFETREINMELTLNDGTAPQPITTGDTVPFTAQVGTGSGSDVLPSDNTFVFNQKVEAAQQDNFIECLEGDTLPLSAAGEYLHYVVNFTNTGTAIANNVVITQQFDPLLFDISTLEILNSTYSLTARVAGNSAEFMMKDANVVAGDGGHGTIIFKVKTRTGLLQNTVVAGQSNILFDFNAPIQTNTATTAFATLSTGDFEKDTTVVMVPNPATTVTRITAQGNIREVVLYDVQGRQLEVLLVNDTEVSIDLASRATGMYFVKVSTEKGVSVQKLIKQ
ncbi:T9SS type A sorting domain-containing protein [Flavobacterium sp. RHBU_3]|uniref:DUF7619 domain-containing protein n=1 Tax=Flavobacterium sp. RHBU_3 TaxID=3391184 RepID=UPI0039852204